MALQLQGRLPVNLFLPRLLQRKVWTATVALDACHARHAAPRHTIHELSDARALPMTLTWPAAGRQQPHHRPTVAP